MPIDRRTGEIVSEPHIRTKYNYARDTRSTAYESAKPSMTVQSQKDEADINVLVKRFGLTGNMPVNVRVPTYGDFTGVESYQEAMNAVIAAENSFMQMNSEVRNRFGNNPELFVKFCSDENNIEEMRKMGLAVTPKPDIIPTVRIQKDDGDAQSGQNVSGTASSGSALAAPNAK